MLDLQLFKLPISKAGFFLCLIPREARSALVRREVSHGALRRLAPIHEEVILVLERPNGRFERRDFRVEVLDHSLARILLLSQKDAAEWGRNEDVEFLGDEGEVGHDWLLGEGSCQRGGMGAQECMEGMIYR